MPSDLTSDRLAGRTAMCPHCKSTRPSIDVLDKQSVMAFFEYRGPGNGHSCDHCSYAPVAHTPEVRGRRHLLTTKLADGHEYSDELGKEFDFYYDGCRGWD
jgi:hypothetical protein